MDKISIRLNRYKCYLLTGANGYLRLGFIGVIEMQATEVHHVK